MHCCAGISLAVNILGCSAGSANANGATGGATFGDGESSALGPGCLGSAGKPCSPYPEGTQCPGGPTACVECGVRRVRALAVVLPLCIGGHGVAPPPPAGQVQCPTPVANADFYVDPSCTVPYVGDAGGDDASFAASCVDAGPIGSCEDADILARRELRPDVPGRTPTRPWWARGRPVTRARSPTVRTVQAGRGALASFEADVAKTPGGVGAPVSCATACTPSPPACCRAGHCRADVLCSGDAGEKD